MIGLFVFIEKSKDTIVGDVMEAIRQKDESGQEMPQSELKALVEQLVEGYNDMLVTGESEVMVLAARGIRLTYLFELPLIIGAAIRRLLAQDRADSDEENGIESFNKALDTIEETARRAACRFLDVFQEDLQKRIDDHNNYLARTQEQLGIDLTSFKIAPR
jgi:hypothetical protein